MGPSEISEYYASCLSVVRKEAVLLSEGERPEVLLWSDSDVLRPVPRRVARAAGSGDGEDPLG